MKRILIVLLLLLQHTIQSQEKAMDYKDSLHVLKLKFEKIDSLPLDQLKQRIDSYKYFLSFGDKFKNIGNRDSANFYYQRAHDLFINETFAFDKIKYVDEHSSLDNYTSNCGGTRLEIRKAQLLKAKAEFLAGYPYQALKVLLAGYESDPTFLLEKRKVILELLESLK